MYTLDESKSSDPLGSSGVMGTAAKNLDKNMTKLVFKKKIETWVPKLAPAVLKEHYDLKLFHDWCHAIHNGKFENDEEQKYYEITPSPKMHNARWWTTFIRILSCFARLKNPSQQWIILVTYVVQAYAKNVFDIHFGPHITMGSVHYNTYLRNSELCLKKFQGDKWLASILRKLKKNDLFQDIIFPVFIRYQNSCYGNPESVLLSAVASDDKTIAQRAFEIYVKALEFHKDRKDIRKFVLKPEWINATAENCLDMINWHMLRENDITPPPLLMGLFDTEHIRKIVYGEGKLEIPPFLSHSQHNERAIKQTTLSAKFNRTHFQQQANILSAKKSRDEFPLQFKLSDFDKKD